MRVSPVQCTGQSDALFQTFEELWIFPMWWIKLLINNLCKGDLTAYFNSTDLSNLDSLSQLLFIHPLKCYYLLVALISWCFLIFHDLCCIWENITSFLQGGHGGHSFSSKFILLSFVYKDTQIQVNVISERKRPARLELSLSGGDLGDEQSWKAVTNSLIFWYLTVKMQNDFIVPWNKVVFV